MAEQKTYTKINAFLKSVETHNGQNLITVSSLISSKTLIEILKSSKEGYFKIYVEGTQNETHQEPVIESYK
jgi:hypothetical protein